MKTLTLLFLLVASLARAVNYEVTTHTLALPWGSTNSITLDVTQTSGVVLQTSITAALAGGTALSVTLTNKVGNSNGFVYTNILAGSTDIFTYTNQAITNLISFGVSNATYTIGSDPGLTDYFSANQTTYQPFTNYIGSNLFTAIFTNVLVLTNTYGTNTNTFYFTNTLAWNNSGGSNLQTLAVTNSTTLTDSTATNTSIFTQINRVIFTNVPNLNYVWVQTNINPAAAVNLSNALNSFYGSALILSSTSPTNITITTPLSATLTGGISANLGLVSSSSASISGGLILTCSNSVDKVTWFADAAHTYTVNFNSTTPVDYPTNFTAIGSFGYWKYTVQNAVGNNASATFTLKKAIKEGL